MQFDYTVLTLVLILATLMVIILIKLIYKHNPHYSEHYGEEIVLFHRSERYKRRVWRFNLIEELKNVKTKEKIIDELKLKVICGEFSDGKREIIKHAAYHGFGSITIISGPKVFSEDRMEIYTLLDQYKNVEYLILPRRPTNHFMIFDKDHLYIEKPHRHNDSRGSVGVKKAQLELIKKYDEAFSKMRAYARPLTKEEVFQQKCY
ncbi:hypothetical protein [Methanobacterium formicicum]|jgi:hypothetical protein|uniref:Uncharacterized protein n=1 Tax=Methanobacterium formicicum TaxID=2162 RepID=A0A0S4FQT8_METFO|nr:hypothetical protein [Methanobacterium formicicum]CEL25430.1 hypothetical protein MB9_1800 [Methanobacterium formicicum]